MKDYLRACRNESGFSLIELIVVIAIIALAATFGIPAFSSWLPNYRLRSASQDLLSNFKLAKISGLLNFLKIKEMVIFWMWVPMMVVEIVIHGI